ncbi:hypothetical protein KOI35_31555 [Actinoplanes bogorensis]|uniref:Uncharacterized protein n=1 Tax=Paractinoplanes bogorensis TaxID=1610840 RepID=A0ABS5YX90_9ACTN|nr:hypothetical protein [Actinoplanes bogorensis]MBU2668057.1 hypothetical protein [Actinoplanes bogorensis]
MRMIRGVVGVLAVVGAAVALAPAPAYALDDLKCVKEDTRVISTRDESGWNTVLVGFCARYEWTPPPVSGGTPPKDQPGGGSGGGGGGNPPAECDDYQDNLKQLGEWVDLLNSEIQAATAEADRLAREAQAARDRNNQALADYVAAQQHAQQLLADYINDNALDPIETEHNGHPIVRPITYSDVKTSLPGGTAVINAKREAEQLGREQRDLQEQWLEVQARSDQANAALYDLQARLQAALEAVKLYQELSSRCR